MSENRSGFVAVIGAPNAGKSTLVNALTGAKVSIVSSKIQTTRMPVRGIGMCGNSQLVFVDTPGIFEPAKRLERAMVASAWQSQYDADIIVLVVDASRKKIDRDTRAIITKLADGAADRPVILVMNKVDKINPQTLLPRVQELAGACPFAATFMISAEKKDGTDDLMKELAKRVPEGPWMYPEDQVSDLPDRLLAAEITREKLFKTMHQELPYALTVETEKWEMGDDNSLQVGQIIFVARESHKPIILGKGGTSIKEIGIAARKEMEAIFERRVRLDLFVKVKENWTEDSEHYKIWGLDFGA